MNSEQLRVELPFKPFSDTPPSSPNFGKQNNVFANRKPLKEDETIWQILSFWAGQALVISALSIGLFLSYACFAFDWHDASISFFHTICSRGWDLSC